MRNTNLFTLFVLSMILVMTSCEKQEFKADPGTPVFLAEIPFINDNGFEAVAGDDLYYMFASHQELDSSIVYSGLFGKENICEEGCAENFAIKIVQNKTITQDLSPGNYEFYSIPKDGFKHNFSLQSKDEEALSWTTWRLGNEDHSGQPSVSFDSNNDALPQEGIQLIYDVPGQFIAQFDRPVLPRTVDCGIELNIKRIINLGLVLEVATTSPFAFVNWSTGETGNRIRLDFETQTYSANIFDGSGCQTKIVINFDTQNMAHDYSIGLDQESIAFSTPDNADRSVIIEYTDTEGDFYTSSIVGQILPFEFNINTIEDYEVNELLEPTWKIDASFDCILFSENGSTKRIKDGNAVFAVSY